MRPEVIDGDELMDELMIHFDADDDDEFDGWSREDLVSSLKAIKSKVMGRRRVLLLHPMCGNGPAFEALLSDVRRRYRGSIDFVAPTSPHFFTPDKSPPLVHRFLRLFGYCRDVRCWFNATDDDPPVYRMLDLAWLSTFVCTNGPFDGVVGYSQGSQMAAMLLAENPNLFKWAAFCAGRRPRDAHHVEYYASAPKNDIPTLHVYGKDDPINWQSKDLAACFYDPEVVALDGVGHGLDFSEDSKVFDALAAFFRAQGIDLTRDKRPAPETPTPVKRLKMDDDGVWYGEGEDEDDRGGLTGRELNLLPKCPLLAPLSLRPWGFCPGAGGRSVQVRVAETAH